MPIPFHRFEPSSSYEHALERAAALWGIEPGYWDIWGRRHDTSSAARRAILEALGVTCGDREEIDRQLEERMWREWSRVAPPTLVTSAGRAPASIRLHIPVDYRTAKVRLSVRWEDRGAEVFEMAAGDLPDSAGAELRGCRFVRKELALPAAAPLGYHDLEVSVAPGGAAPLRACTRWIVCPERAWTPPQFQDGRKAGGIVVSLYGVRSRRNWGCGDFTDLAGIIDWAAEEAGASFVGLNPLHALHNRQPYNTSPYLPNSIFYRNLLYLDVERIEDFRGSRRARSLFGRPETQAELEALRAAPLVEYERVQAVKLRFLKLCFQHFLKEYRRGSARSDQFQKFIAREGELLDRYATYCALDEWIHAQKPDIWIWPDWPEKYRDPDSDATWGFARRHPWGVLFFKYVQWQIDLQLAAVQAHALERGLAVGLYHDLALATDRCGSDLWAHGPYYVSGCRVGSPPDDFSPQGQDWAFPPPNAERHRETGYRLFVESIRANSRHGGALRIDHVMRFFRLFWIPEGMDAAQGVYVRDHHEDLLRILALESVRGKFLVVGEDLGTVEPAVREELEKFGILSYRLFYFERDGDGSVRPPSAYPRQALVAPSTHDLPTLAGFWTGRDIEARRGAGLLADESGYRAQWAARAAEKQKMLDSLRGLGLLPEWFPRDARDTPELTGELHNAIVGFLASTPSLLLAVNQEDLTKETEQQNLPGSTWQYPNWRRKMKYSVEELRSSPAARGFTLMFRNWLERTGRLNTGPLV